MNHLEQYREDKDKLFQADPNSPLTAQQKVMFDGLSYYPENDQFRFEVETKIFENKERVLLTTSTGSVQPYIRYAEFEFEVDGKTARLTIFAGDYDYFLPFVDAGAGQETYGAGRYLEPYPLSPTRFIIDFNYAYNPYCAYNENWSCPLPPAENRVPVFIRAGEKMFQE